jgi:2-oxo-4-hydroxy-4-carboxy-5-ureidoimidazoline decarboxylase
MNASAPPPHRQLSALSPDDAREALSRCCGARAWVTGMLALRPFASEQALLSAAQETWSKLGKDDYLEAFSHHPQIGADRAELARRFAGTAQLSAAEQAGVTHADASTLDALAEANRAYLARFGYIFIVCATGKSAEQMLSLLQARLPNDPEIELQIAAAEQAKITALRLQRLAP